MCEMPGAVLDARDTTVRSVEGGVPFRVYNLLCAEGDREANG